MIGMASKGLTQTSSLIQISASVVEAAANTFTIEQIDLQLNPLDREVFVVQAVDLDMFAPDLVANTATEASMSLSSTRRTTVGGIDMPNVIAAKRIKTQSVTGDGSVTNEYMASDTPASNLDYIAIVATNDIFMNIEGRSNVQALAANARVYGYRARADAAIYAALVQSEALSA
uniref:Uncharacterized protein n=1 Tax=uncultured marine virus TaxID=186617 RepID=S4TEL7_9VIRU|nr:hypothetical protein [uncultured marine virus]